MKTIKDYLKKLKKEIRDIKDFTSIFDELRIHLYEEFEDYCIVNSNQPKKLMEEDYVNSLEKIEDIAKSFRMKDLKSLRINKNEIFKIRKDLFVRLLIAYFLSLIVSWILATTYNLSVNYFANPLNPPSNSDMVSTNLVYYIFWPGYYGWYPPGSWTTNASINLAMVTSVVFLLLILFKIERIFRRFRFKKIQDGTNDFNQHLMIEKTTLTRWIGAYLIVVFIVFWINFFSTDDPFYHYFMDENVFLSLTWPIYFIHQLDRLIFLLSIKSQFTEVLSYKVFLVPLYEMILLQLVTIIMFFILIYLKWERILTKINNKIGKVGILKSRSMTINENKRIVSILLVGIIFLIFSGANLISGWSEIREYLDMNQLLTNVLLIIGAFSLLISGFLLLNKKSQKKMLQIGNYFFYFGLFLISSTLIWLYVTWGAFQLLIFISLSLIPLLVHFRLFKSSTSKTHKLKRT